jgi:hypothetical protein
MKKCLVVLAAIMALVLLVPMASASTLCGQVGAATPGLPALTGQPVTMTCSSIVVPTNQTLTSIDVILVDDAQGPLNNGSSVNWVWTVVSGVPGGTQTNVETSTNGYSFNNCSGSGINNTCGPSDLNYSESVTAGNTFNAVSFLVSAYPSSPLELVSNGGDSAEMYVQYNYTSGVPEPATLGLMGVALLGLGVFARKRSTRP